MSQLSSGSGTAGYLRYTYRDGNGAIQDVLLYGGPYDSSSILPGNLQQINLMQVNHKAMTAGPAAAGDPFVLNAGTTKHFVYRDGSGTIWDARYDGRWQLLQINIIPITGGILASSGGIVGETDGPPAAGDPFVVGFGQQQHFAYRDAHGGIWDSWNEGNGLWGLDQIPMQTTRAASGPIVSVYSGQLHFTYRDFDGAIYDAWHVPGNQSWTVQKLNLGGLTTGSAAATPAISFAPVDGGGSSEHIDGLSVAVDPGGTFGINGMCASLGSTLHVAYRDVSGDIQDVWYDGSGGWHLQQVLPRPPSQCKVPLKLIGPSTSLNLTAGRAVYGVNFSASGGTPGYRFQASGLPARLSLSSVGALTGMATAAGRSTITVTVTDSAGTTSSGVYVVNVLPAPQLKVAGPSTLSFTVGIALSGVAFSASGGIPGYSFSASGLPAGLSLSSAGGLAGTPTVSGQSSTTVTVKDSAGAAASSVFVITVSPTGGGNGNLTLSLKATPLPLYLANALPISVDEITWVVTPDWNPGLSQTIVVKQPGAPYATHSVTLPAPSGLAARTARVTISGKWSTQGGVAGGFNIDPQSGADMVINGNDSTKTVAFIGTNEEIIWDLSVPYTVDQGNNDTDPTINYWVLVTYGTIQP
jgi:hypothetical protein